jgi:hypothetical protein
MTCRDRLTRNPRTHRPGRRKSYICPPPFLPLDSRYSSLRPGPTGALVETEFCRKGSEEDLMTFVRPHALRRAARGAAATAVTGIALLATASAASALTASPSSVTEGQSFVLSTPNEVTGTPNTLDIINDDNGNQVGSCITGGPDPCTATITAPWAQNGHPSDLHYHVQIVGSNGQTIDNEAPITVSVSAYPFAPSLTSSPSSVTEGDTFTLSAPNVVKGTPDNLLIVDDNGNQVGSCNTGNSDPCTATIYAHFAQNGPPTDLHYHVEILAQDGTVVANSSTLTVPVHPYPFQVALYPSASAVNQGDQITLTAVTNAAGTSDWVNIMEDNTSGGSQVGGCGATSTCTTNVNMNTTGDQSFYVEILSPDRQTVVARSADITVAVESPGNVSAGLDLPATAAFFTSTQQLCDTMLGYPGTHLQGSSLSDQELACQSVENSGGAPTDVLKKLATMAGGAGTLYWVLHYAYVSTVPGGAPLGPPASLPVTSPSAPAGALPAPWPVDAVAGDLIAANPTAALTAAEAEELAKYCLFNASLADLDAETACRTVPIFAPGSDVSEATEHVISALTSINAPSWVKLNYEKADYKASSDTWYDNAGYTGCENIDPSTQDCDEYPFFATAQGGQFATPTPSLTPVDYRDNQLEGSYYGGFITKCNMQSGPPEAPNGQAASLGDAFLVVPTPPEDGIPTLSLCNGKS